MSKLGRNTTIFRNEFYIGDIVDKDLFINNLQNKLNKLMNTEVVHRNERFKIIDIEIMEHEHIKFIMVVILILERLGENKELIDIICEARNKAWGEIEK